MYLDFARELGENVENPRRNGVDQEDVEDDKWGGADMTNGLPIGIVVREKWMDLTTGRILLWRNKSNVWRANLQNVYIMLLPTLRKSREKRPRIDVGREDAHAQEQDDLQRRHK